MLKGLVARHRFGRFLFGEGPKTVPPSTVEENQTSENGVGPPYSKTVPAACLVSRPLSASRTGRGLAQERERSNEGIRPRGADIILKGTAAPGGRRWTRATV